MSRSQGTLSFDIEFLEAVLGKARKPGTDPLVVMRSYTKPPGSSAEYLQVVAPGIFFSLCSTRYLNLAVFDQVSFPRFT